MFVSNYALESETPHSRHDKNAVAGAEAGTTVVAGGSYRDALAPENPRSTKPRHFVFTASHPPATTAATAATASLLIVLKATVLSRKAVP